MDKKQDDTETVSFLPRVHDCAVRSQTINREIWHHIFEGNLTAERLISIYKESLVPNANNALEKQEWT